MIMGTMMMSCTMYLDKTYILAELPEDLADDIISWGYDYVNDDFLYKENNDYGRTHNTHVTVLSDLKQQNVRNIKETVETESPFNCTLGNIKKFTTNSKFDVLYIEILDEEIKKIHIPALEFILTRQYGIKLSEEESCPWCGKICKNNAGVSAHLKSCKEAPTK